MATNNSSLTSVYKNSPVRLFNRAVFSKAEIIGLLFFTLLFLLPSLSQADGLFDFQMKMAKKGGNPEAEFKVGEMYETGFGTKKDMAEAEKWINKAANQGHETAGFKLLYWDVEKNGFNDANKAKVDELKAKAKAGNAQAEYYIGKMYANGVGLKKDTNKAIKWLNKAALVGVLAAERELTDVREAKDIQDIARKKKADKKRAQKKERERKAKLDAQRKLEADKKAASVAAAAAATATATATAKKQQEADAASAKAANNKAAEQAKAQAEADKRQAKAKKAEAEKQARIKKQKEEEQKRNAKFESDPCSGKSARFLSTCR